MNRDAEAMDRAFAHLYPRNYFPLPDGHGLAIACLVREADWRPLDAPWWRKKEASIIGAELNGNFILRHCDGSVRYWDHATQTDTMIAPSVREFCAKLIIAPLTDEPWRAEHRAKLNAYFRKTAKEQEIVLNPTVWDERTTILTGRSFEETKGCRAFQVDPRDDWKGIDAYTKRIGLDDEVTLLNVSADPDPAHFPLMWSAYVKWIHEGLEESEVLASFPV